MKKPTDIVLYILRDVERKHLYVVAAGVAYYFLISLFPALLLLTAVLAYIPLQNTMHGASSFMAHVMPPQGMSLLEGALDTITPHRTGLLSLGIIATLWASSIGIKGIIAGLDIVYGVRIPRSLWVNRLLAFGLAIGVGALLLIGVILTLTGPVLEAALSSVVPVQSLWIRLWPNLQWSVAAIFTFAAIELLYLLGPNVPMARRTTVPGALIAACSWLALSWGLRFYMHDFGLKLNRLYGALSAPVALLIWLNWGALVILMGAEINLSLQFHRKSQEPRPDKTAAEKMNLV